MITVDHLEACHRATRLALEIHRKWSSEDESKLLERSLQLKGLIEPFFVLIEGEWPRQKNLKRHAGVLCSNLQNGRQEDSRCDIDDLVYDDLPSLTTQLLRLYREQSTS